MRKFMIILGIMITSIVLVGCQDDGESITPPTFVGFTIDGEEPVIDGSLKTFYKNKDEETLIEIQIQNPDNTTIKSVVINGYDYHSSRFSEESTDSIKVFVMSAGDDLGQTIYSIDEINYMDGDSEKPIRNFTDNEFVLYVVKTMPTVVRDDYEFDQDQIFVDLEITDEDDVIVEGTLLARLYLSDNLIDEQEVPLEDESGDPLDLSSLVFTGLDSNRQYELRVSASYDLDDEAGFQSNKILFSGIFETESKALPTASIQNLSVASNKVRFDVYVEDEDNVLVDGGLSAVVFDEDNLVVAEVPITMAFSTVEFDGLLNDAYYNIRVLADYDLDDGASIQYNQIIGSRTIETSAQTVPELTIENKIVEENLISFDILLDETQSVIIVDTMYANLYFEGNLVNTVDISGTYVGFQVLNVFANYEFTIEILGDYDLNDGTGVFEDQLLLSETFSTLEKTLPELSVTETTISQDTVILTLSVDDPDETLFGAVEARLYENDTLIDSVLFNKDDTNITFYYATSYSENYYIEVIGDYDLSDGSPLVEDYLFYRGIMVTGQKKTPVTEFTSIESTDDSIYTRVFITDSDMTIVEGTIYLDVYYDFQLLESFPLVLGANDVFIDGLGSNSDIDLYIRATYSLKEDASDASEGFIGQTSQLTQSKYVPTGEIGNLQVSTSDLTFDINVVDTDGAAIPDTYYYEFLKDDVVIDYGDISGLAMFNLNYQQLLANTSYTVKLYGEYDLNDGEGIHSGLIYVEEILTDANQLPYGDIEEHEEGNLHNLIRFTLNFYDVDGVTKNNTFVRIYQGEELVYEEMISVGDTFISVTPLLPETGYDVKIVTDYDLEDGRGIIEGQVVETFSVFTTKVDVVTVESETITETSNDIALFVNDQDDILTNLITATLIEGEREIATYVFSKDTPTQIELLHLLSGYDYVLEVTGTYTTGNGDVTDVLYRHEFTTLAYELPIVNILPTTELDEDDDPYWDLGTSSMDYAATVDVSMLEEDEGAQVVGWMAYLYQDGVLIEEVDITDDIDYDDEVQILDFRDYDPDNGDSITIVISVLVDMNSSREENVVEVQLASRTIIDAEPIEEE